MYFSHITVNNANSTITFVPWIALLSCFKLNDSGFGWYMLSWEWFSFLSFFDLNNHPDPKRRNGVFNTKTSQILCYQSSIRTPEDSVCCQFRVWNHKCSWKLSYSTVTLKQKVTKLGDLWLFFLCEGSRKRRQGLEPAFWIIFNLTCVRV